MHKSLLAGIIFLLGFASSAAFADHEHGNHGPAFEALEAHLEARKLELMKNPGTNEDAATEKLLIDAAKEELQAEVAERNEHSKAALFVHEAFDHLKDHLNVAKISNWLRTTAMTKGPFVAATFAVNQMVEASIVVFALTHPQWIILTPLALSHVTDTIAVGVGLGLPKVWNTIKIWRRHAGLLSGAVNRYNHLLSQREFLDADWDQIINMTSLETLAPGLAADEAPVAVVWERRLFRKFPRKANMVFRPKITALKESMTYVSIQDLEDALKKSGANLKSLKGLKGNNAVYSAVLVQEISENAAAQEWLAGVMEPRVKTAAAPLPASDFDKLLREGSFEDFENLKEPADVTAQRALWYLQELQKANLADLDSHPKELKNLRSVFKDIQKELGPKSLLATRAETPQTSLSAQPLAEVIDSGRQTLAQIEGLRAQIDLQLNPPENCLRLMGFVIP